MKENAEMKKGHNCPICEKMRSLPDHIYELSEYCRFLDNSGKKCEGIIPQTTTVGSWLKLAACLEEVKINNLKYEGNSASYCGGEYWQQEAETYEKYTKALLRATLVLNALDELYRFVSIFYDKLSPRLKIQDKRCKERAFKAARLIDLATEKKENDIPKYMCHAKEQFLKWFNQYQNMIFLSSDQPIDERLDSQSPTYCLHIVRRLRNHIFHGTFSICDSSDVDDGMNTKINLLSWMVRMTLLYMQILLTNYNDGFQSNYYYDLKDMKETEEEEDIEDDDRTYNFILPTISDGNILHIKGEMSFMSFAV